MWRQHDCRYLSESTAITSHPQAIRRAWHSDGANTDDYAWTETMMARRAIPPPPDPTPLAYIDHNRRSACRVHFYTFAGNDWYDKGRAVGFNRSGWATAMARTRKTDELIARHSAILDRTTPTGRWARRQRMGRVVGEREAPVGTLSGKHAARRGDRGPHPEHLPEPCGARADGQSRPDGERHPGPDPDRQGGDGW